MRPDSPSVLLPALALSFLAACRATDDSSADEAPTPRLLSVERIWDEAPHNAFTDIVQHDDRWYCVFREGQGHVSPDGALRVIASDDGKSWNSAARVTMPTADLRDPKLSVTPSGSLYLSGAAAYHGGDPFRHQTYAWTSEDGQSWSEAREIGDPNLWMWRVSWHPDGTGYGIGYGTAEGKIVRLYRSNDGGESFDVHVDDLGVEGYPNESSIVFLPDDTALCLLRRDPANGLLGEARPPYREWTWRDIGMRIGGPHMIRLPHGRLVAAVRLYDGGARTSVCEVNREDGKIHELLRLPSGGDTSYPGLVWHENLLWVSYYSSHEEKTSIYLARLDFSSR